MLSGSFDLRCRRQNQANRAAIIRPPTAPMTMPTIMPVLLWLELELVLIGGSEDCTVEGGVVLLPAAFVPLVAIRSASV